MGKHLTRVHRHFDCPSCNRSRACHTSATCSWCEKRVCLSCAPRYDDGVFCLACRPNPAVDIRTPAAARRARLIQAERKAHGNVKCAFVYPAVVSGRERCGIRRADHHEDILDVEHPFVEVA